MKFSVRQFIANSRSLFFPKESYFAISEILLRGEQITEPEESAEWFEHLIRWLKKNDTGIERYKRCIFFFELLERRPEYKKAFYKQLTVFLTHKSFLRLLMQTGYSDHHNMIDEIKAKIGSKILPTVSECDFFEITQASMTDEEDLQWLVKAPEVILLKFDALLAGSEELKIAFYESTREAIVLLSVQIASIGLNLQIRERSAVSRASQSPFLALQIYGTRLVADPVENKDRLLHEIIRLIQQCRLEIQNVVKDMEANGTSVALVFKVELLTEFLARFERLTQVFCKSDLGNLHSLIVDCVEATVEKSSVFSQISRSSHLLSRKIVEHNSESGEHYIGHSISENRALFISSLKGGLIVLFMTLLKISLIRAGNAPLLSFILTWIIYSGGFLLMQFTDSTLATKLPSFTASKLVRLFKNVQSVSDLDAIAFEFKAVLKSQGLSFAGNIFALAPAAVVFHFLYKSLSASPFIMAPVATAKLMDLHPFLSLAIPMGALTGVLLWLSSLAGGWFENWLIFRKIPLAICEHRRLRRTFGQGFSLQLGRWLQANASGIGANIALGFLFGIVPMFGNAFGYHVDSQHVTIASSTAALAISELGINTNSNLFVWSLLGLVFIGLGNLLVSFGLALFVAARASAINPRRFKILLKLMVLKIFRG
jgi:site-specific recombinase